MQTNAVASEKIKINASGVQTARASIKRKKENMIGSTFMTSNSFVQSDVNGLGSTINFQTDV